MADYATLLRDHVTLTCRSVDRVFLQAYVPKLQSVGGVCQFLYLQKGFSIPSSAAFGMNRPRFYAHFLCWERRRWCPPPWSGKSCVDLASDGGAEGRIGRCVSRSTPVFLWCCEPVWERGGGGRTVSRLLAGTVDCCFEHV